MPYLKPLAGNPDIRFIAGRNFKWNGDNYTRGDEVDVPMAFAFSRLEMLVRNRFLIPWCDDPNDVPRTFAKDMKSRRWVETHIGAITDRTPNKDAGTFEDGATIQEVKTYLDRSENRNAADWALALLTEHNGANRVTLVNYIKAGKDPDDPTAEDIELFVLDEDNYANGAQLEDFDAADGNELYA